MRWFVGICLAVVGAKTLVFGLFCLVLWIRELYMPVDTALLATPASVEVQQQLKQTVQQGMIQTFLVFTLFPVLTLLVARMLVRQTIRALLARSICPTCGYSLAGLQKPSCPECGGIWDGATA
jgi:predicted Zn-ribbon and HTH transcriptional regulator